MENRGRLQGRGNPQKVLKAGNIIRPLSSLTGRLWMGDDFWFYTGRLLQRMSTMVRMRTLHRKLLWDLLFVVHLLQNGCCFTRRWVHFSVPFLKVSSCDSLIRLLIWTYSFCSCTITILAVLNSFDTCSPGLPSGDQKKPTKTCRMIMTTLFYCSCGDFIYILWSSFVPSLDILLWSDFLFQCFTSVTA